ncbi:low molecular weight protein-tyrosine-phosphatase [Marinobacter fonticola]|uniref:low molecular weight protein-tyrosine-phosphatase n=1 Tax=Marinobacter fonticola TaxID=2603215 RepID=UPI0011E716A3|nr:low molecular weight protein-tyrosine-phosphatase [Marinobacter fonticola]
MHDPVNVLFVCMGNICRSPTAQAVFQQRLDEAGLTGRVTVDSCGTGEWHVGKQPDPRAMEAGLRRGYDLSSLRARQIEPRDMDRFDYVLTMDSDNQRRVAALTSDNAKARPELFLSYATRHQEEEVPDPYYGDGDGFERVLDLIEDACDGLIRDIRENRL